MEEKVIEIIANQLCINPSKITLESKLEGLKGADSLDMIEIVMALEEELAIEIPDEDAEKLETVGDVIKYCKDKMETGQNNI